MERCPTSGSKKSLHVSQKQDCASNLGDAREKTVSSVAASKNYLWVLGSFMGLASNDRPTETRKLNVQTGPAAIAFQVVASRYKDGPHSHNWLVTVKPKLILVMLVIYNVSSMGMLQVAMIAGGGSVFIIVSTGRSWPSAGHGEVCQDAAQHDDGPNCDLVIIIIIIIIIDSPNSDIT